MASSILPPHGGSAEDTCGAQHLAALVRDEITFLELQSEILRLQVKHAQDTLAFANQLRERLTVKEAA